MKRRIGCQNHQQENELKKRTSFEASLDKVRAVNALEDTGMIADSRDVRADIINRIKSGEISLEQGQKELKEIQRKAKSNGKTTRPQAYRNG